MVSRRLTAALLFGATAASARLGAQMPTVASIKPLVSRGTYVFEAVMVKANAIADSLLSAADQTAVVRVTHVFACPREVGNFTGELVTIAESGPHAAVGTRSWYFGSGWAIGDRVATRVLRRVDSLNTAMSLRFIDSLRAAVRLSYRDAVRAAARASDSIVIATFGTLQSVMMDLAPPKAERPERWMRLNVMLDSIRAFEDTSSNDTAKFAPGWVVPASAARNTGILVPYDVAYDVLGRVQLTPGTRRMLFFERLSRRPNVEALDRSAAGFLPNADGIRPLSDAAQLGRTLAMPTFTLAPVQECPQPGR